MREHPLLMKGPLVRATLEGRKTQTRRPLPDVFNSPPDLIYGWLPPGEWKLFGATMERWGAQWRGTYPSQVLCPLGRAGDRLWVRETFQSWRKVGHESDEWEPIGASYASAGDTIEYRATSKSTGPWTPSIHMPRWACRLVLPLVSVRVERVQDITEEDAKAEGVERISAGPGWECWMGYGPSSSRKTARDSFRSLWISIYGEASWDANPWVWVAEWKEIEVSR